jgi:putative ABC transport system permease protein
VQARARRSRDLAAVAQALAAAIPDAEVRTPLSVAGAEAQVLRHLERLLGLVAAVVLGACVLAVFATMAGAVLARRREVGVMKTLGAEASVVVRLFAAEAAAIGLAGGLLGFGVGVAFAEAVAWQAFGLLVVPSVLALVTSLGLGLGIALAASVGPVHRAARIAPITVLRGE